MVRRAFVFAVSLAMVAGLAVPAAADHPEAIHPEELMDLEEAIARLCPVGEFPEPDTPDHAGVHADMLACAVWWELLDLVSDGSTLRSRPWDVVTRSEMARAVAAAMDRATVNMPIYVADFFTDIAGDPNEFAIKQLWSYQIVAGTGGRQFSPDSPLTRGQMATFLVRAFDSILQETDYVFPMHSEDFTDIAGTAHEESIRRVAGLGIAQGFGDGTFHPEWNLTRGQIATFLMRMLAAVNARQLPLEWPNTDLLFTAEYRLEPQEDDVKYLGNLHYTMGLEERAKCSTADTIAYVGGLLITGPASEFAAYSYLAYPGAGTTAGALGWIITGVDYLVRLWVPQDSCSVSVEHAEFADALWQASNWDHPTTYRMVVRQLRDLPWPAGVECRSDGYVGNEKYYEVTFRDSSCGFLEDD